MTCGIEIADVFGRGNPLEKIIVVGTVQDCPPDVDGSTLQVQLNCRSADSADFKTQTADIDSVGNWTADFAPPFPDCTCNGQVFVTARCLSVEGCEAPPFRGVIKCDDCPSLNFNDRDDVRVGDIQVECDVDGTALVKISFPFFNDTASFIKARVNCGPGGTEILSDAAFVTPNSSADVVAVCRYDPTITPQPVPFVEFVHFPGVEALDCPPVPIPVPALPECEVGACPASAILEVTDGSGGVVIVSGPNAVLCLLPGPYAVTVVSPLAQPTIQYFWSQNNTLITPLVTDQSITVNMEQGDVTTLGVAITSEGCPPLAASATLTACVIDCDASLTLELRDDQGNFVNLSQSCIPPGNYTLHAVGPEEPPWDFKWTVNGVLSNVNTTAQLVFAIGPGDGVSIQVVASAPGCEDKSDVVTFRGCEDVIIDDSAGCAALLFSAIGFLIAGAILIIVGVCISSTTILIIGGVTTAVGLILLGIWLWKCQDSTSCDSLAQARCLLNYAGVLFLFVSVVLGWFSGIACGVPAILSSIGWFGLSSLITDVMAVKQCEIKPCFL